MGIDQKILVRAKGLAATGACAWAALFVLSACGQKGNLYLPDDPDFQGRATLHDIVRRQLPGQTVTPPAPTASAPASKPQATPSPAGAASGPGR